jgi:hypothetical protein
MNSDLCYVVTLFGGPKNKEARAVKALLEQLASDYRKTPDQIMRDLLRHLVAIERLQLLPRQDFLSDELMAGLTAIELVRGRLVRTLDACDAVLAGNEAMIRHLERERQPPVTS